MNRLALGVLSVLVVASLTCRPPMVPGAKPLGSAFEAVAPGDLSSDPAPPAAFGRALSPPEVDAVLTRMPPLAADASEAGDFALRSSSLPPPRTGKLVSQPFPPLPSTRQTPVATSEPLEVLRVAPQGEEFASHVNVTFSQPMVEVTSHEELAAQAVPVKLTPSPPGRWRWAGTKTLLFEPRAAGLEAAGRLPAPTRLPGATEYQVEIPPGTKSATGRALRASYRWKFATPPAKVMRTEPLHGTQRRNAIMFVAFDQKIDPEAVLATISVDGRKGTALRQATTNEIAGDEAASEWVRQVEGEDQSGGKRARRARRWVAFRTVDPLPADRKIVVRIGPGTPSAEGPLRSKAAAEFFFHTFGPMQIASHGCGPSWGQDESCSPRQGFQIRFSNAIDPETFKPAMVKVVPDIPGFAADVSGDTLHLRGGARARTTYAVTVAGNLQDRFGQSLGKPARLTWKTSSVRPALFGPRQTHLVLDPAGPPRLPIHTINHKRLYVRLYAVSPADWFTFLRFRTDSDGVPSSRSPPGKLVFDRQVPIGGPEDQPVETSIDLSSALRLGVGHVVAWISVKPFEVAGAQNPGFGWQSAQLATWVQATQIGLAAFTDGPDVVAWANSLADGKPLGEVEVALEPFGTKGKSGEDGLTRLRFGQQAVDYLLVARRGTDVAILPDLRADNPWPPRDRPQKQVVWYVLDGRQMYRPGEEVRWKGWLRIVDTGKGGDVGGAGGFRNGEVRWQLDDARGNKVATGSLPINAQGGFDGRVKLPPNMNLGHARLELTAENVAHSKSTYSHTIPVQEFRRPEFEVKATSSAGPHFVGDRVSAVVTATYYTGGGLPNAPVRWIMWSQPTTYAPPGHDEFTFGAAEPPLLRRRGGKGGANGPQSREGATDPRGQHSIEIATEAPTPPRPIAHHAQAYVLDVNRQEWSAQTEVLVHPADRYVGLKSARSFVERGQPIHVDTVVTDVDGSAVTDTPVNVRAVRIAWVQRKGRYTEEELDPQKCTLAAGAGLRRCSFEAREGGVVKVRATVADGKRRKNESELSVWVSGGQEPPGRSVDQEAVTLVADKKSYAVGETAEILVRAPFAGGEGVVSLRRSGLVETRRFTMKSSSHTLTVPILDGYVPNVVVQVDLVGRQTRTESAGGPLGNAPARPAFATGSLELSVPPRSRSLDVAVQPARRALEPGASTAIDVVVKNAAGQPVAGAEVAVVVVDEAILALSGYRLADPLMIFYPRRFAEVQDHHLRRHLLLPDVNLINGRVNEGASGGLFKRKVFAGTASAVKESFDSDLVEGGPEGGTAGGGTGTPLFVRTNLDALALFAPALATNAKGRASVGFKLPDNLTRYRVMAVAVHGERSFGASESSVTARLPLMVRASAPRFLNFGDKFELPVVVQNQTDSAQDVDVVVRASNVMLIGGGTGNAVGRRVSVPANNRVEVRFPAGAVLAGKGRFQVGAVAGKWSDAAEVSLPVWTPATTEAFATYGTVDEGAVVQPVKAPAAVFPQFGGLEVTTSSTELMSLADAVLYLVRYPFECTEQLASRILAVAALKDVLTAFRVKDLPPADELASAIKRDLRRLEGLQNDGGGFGFWRRHDEDWPFLSVHVIHALVRAKEKGFDVPAAMLRRGHEYLKNVDRNDRLSTEYSDQAREAIRAYALYVRARLGDRDLTKATQILGNGLNRIGMETIAWLYPVLSGGGQASRDQVEQIRRHLANRVSEQAGTAHFTTDYGDVGYLLLASDRRVDAVLLEGLIADQPQSDLIPKLVRGLLAHRTAGRWASTQESAWALLGLDRYFQAFEKETPDFTVRAWLGDKLAGEHRFEGRNTERSQVNLPMSFLTGMGGAGLHNLTVAKNGRGRLYYRVGMQYAPKDLTPPATEQGFTVARAYEAIDRPDDVRVAGPGVWRIKAGARVRVHLMLVATARRYHVALVDPIAAGLEALNPELAVMANPPEAPDRPDRRGPRLWEYPWYQHQNLRDERVEAFASLLREGVYTYSYVARATTPGTFVVPPARAEEMYHPEVFGRSAGDRVIVE